MSDNTKHPGNGFTIVELLVSISLISLISLSVLGVFTNYLVIITRNNVMVDMTIDSQNLLRSIVEELRYGSGVRQTNNIVDSYGPVGGWNTTNTNFVIIIAVPALNSNGDYIIDTNTGKPYNNELVYFKEENTLYKRTLAHPSATGNSLKTSCPAAQVSSSCPADRKLASNVKEITFLLYDQDNNYNQDINSEADTLSARSIGITLLLERDTYGQPLSYVNSIRVTLRNNFR